MRTESSGRWVRGWVGDTAVVDTRRPTLFWEDSLPVSFYAFPVEDVAMELLVPGAEPTGRPPFFTPQGPVRQWYDLVVGDQRRPGAAYVRDDPALAGLVVVSWLPGLLDRWTEEDEEVAGHARDPYHRVDALPSSRHVTVSAGGVLLADSHRPVVLFETGLPTRYYLPADDVRFEHLAEADNRSHCPYKGDADRYWSTTGDPALAGVAWSYTAPMPAVAAIAGRIAFYNELVDLTVDGVAETRPDSPFRDEENRP